MLSVRTLAMLTGLLLSLFSPASAAIEVNDGTRRVQSGGFISLGSVAKNATATAKTITIRNGNTAPTSLGSPASGDSTLLRIDTNYTSNQILAPGQSISISVRLKNTTKVGYVSTRLNVAGQNFTVFGAVTNGEIIIDNLDAGFSTSGPWPRTSPGYGQQQLRTPGIGYNKPATAAATWTFRNLTPGKYDIGATWSGNNALVGNAQYIIYDGGSPISKTAANQLAQSVSSYPIPGCTPYQRLTTVTIKSTTLSITVTNQENFSNRDIAADAMLVLRLN